MSDVQSDMIERGNLLFAVFGSNLRRTTFTNLFLFFSMLLQLDRLQLTAFCCNRRKGVKTTPQKTRFRSVNLGKEIAYRSEIE